jgi:hypothetical protein
MPLRGGRSFPSPGHEEEAEDVRARAGPPREQHHRAAVSGRRLHGRVTTDNRGVRRRRLELRDLQNGRRRSVRTAADGKNGGRARGLLTGGEEGGAAARRSGWRAQRRPGPSAPPKRGRGCLPKARDSNAPSPASPRPRQARSRHAPEAHPLPPLRGAPTTAPTRDPNVLTTPTRRPSAAAAARPRRGVSTRCRQRPRVPVKRGRGRPHGTSTASSSWRASPRWPRLLRSAVHSEMVGRR